MLFFGAVLGESLLWIGLPMGVLFGAFFLLMREADWTSRPPFSGKPLRPPGEHLRLKIDTMTDAFLMRFVITLAVVSVAGMTALRYARTGNTPAAVFVAAVGTALGLGLLLWCWRHARNIRNHVLGYQGERVVGEELNRLMLEGCHVFHDLAMDRIGNLDHVVVAPHAVFVVETKAKRKRRKKGAEETHKVAFNGRTLEFPFGTESGDLDQARRGANALAERLSRLTRQPVTVKPVLILPGWYVERKGRGDVAVVNDKPSQIRGAILNRSEKPMATDHRDRIVELLTEWSRESMG